MTISVYSLRLVYTNGVFMSTTIPIPNTQRFGIGTAALSGNSTLQSLGDVLSGSSGGSGSFGGITGPDATNGVYLPMSTGTTNNSFIAHAGSRNWRGGRNCLYQCRLVLSGVSNIRVWLGLTDQSMANMRSDTPTGANIAAFLLSTASTKWQTVTANGGTFTTTASSQAPDTNNHTYEVSINNGTGTVTYSIDGSSIGTNTTNLPSSSANLAMCVFLHCLTAANTQLNLHYYYNQADF